MRSSTKRKASSSRSQKTPEKSSPSQTQQAESSQTIPTSPQPQTPEKIWLPWPEGREIVAITILKDSGLTCVASMRINGRRIGEVTLSKWDAMAFTLDKAVRMLGNMAREAKPL